jgi:transposase
VSIQEAVLDGFWLHRVLEAEGIESHAADAASIAAPRRRRRAKSDRIDGESLLRVLLACKRGEPRVCAMVQPPSPAPEDRRRVSRERRTLVAQRTEEINRIEACSAPSACSTTPRAAGACASGWTRPRGALRSGRCSPVP